MEKTVETSCMNNCGGRCLLRVRTDGERVLGITTESAAEAGEAVPLSACPKGLHSHETFLGPDRISSPMKRVGPRGEGRFEPISWDEALDITAREWIRIRDTYGVGSRYVNYATGQCSVLRGSHMARRLLALDGGFLGSYYSYSAACMAKASEIMYGTEQTGNSLRLFEESEFIILWSHNPADSRYDSTMHHLRRAKAKGVPIVVVDPRRSTTVKQLGAEWIAIRPATDAAMLDAMAYEIYTRGLHDAAFLERCCLGFEDYVNYLTGKDDGVIRSAEWAAPICGVDAETIRSLAIRYAGAKPAALIQGLGAQRHACGEQAARGAITLAAMTGNVGVRGGWSGGNAFIFEHATPKFPQPADPFPMSIPVFTWTQAVERGGEMTEYDGVRGGEKLPSNIKMIVNLAGNCLINQHSDINRTSEILRDESKCEFILCSDLFMTPSAKFADILLPGISFFEYDNITPPWMYGGFLCFNKKVVEPLGDSRHEYDWLRELAARLGLEEEFSEGRTKEQWLEHIYNDLRSRETELPTYEEFSKGGIYRYKHTADFIAFEKSVQDPEKYPFNTPSGRIEIYSPSVAQGKYRDFFPPIPRYVQPPEGFDDPLAERYPLQLIGWHSFRRCHSVHDNNASLEAMEPQRLYIHPADAAPRGIAEGDTVLVFNDRGRIRIPAHLTEDLRPGVTALSQGAWYAPDAEGTDIRGCINTLTSLRPTAGARGNPQHTNLVEVVGDKKNKL